MGRETSGTNQSLVTTSVTNPVFDSDLISFSLWVIVQSTGDPTLIWMNATGNSAGLSAEMVLVSDDGVITNDYKFQFRSTPAAGNQGRWRSTTEFIFGTLYHVYMSYDRGNPNTDPLCEINGVTETMVQFNTYTNVPKTTVNTIRFGENVGGGADFDGVFAEFGFWTRVLNAGEQTYLAAGGLPWRIQDSLIFYAPFWGIHTVEPELVQQADLTNTGSTLADHPPVSKFHRPAAAPIRVVAVITDGEIMAAMQQGYQPTTQPVASTPY